MNFARKSKIPVFFTSLMSMLVLQEQANAQDVRKLCYQISSKQGDAYILGDVFRQGLLDLTQTNWNAAANTALSTVAPPADAKRCDGKTPPPLAAPTANTYLGNITNKAKFLRLAAMQCGTNTSIQEQYFSIGDAIYYRNCKSGAQTGYVYFWGRPDGNRSQCFGSTYPEMFAIANPTKDPVTPERMTNIYYGNGGAPTMASQADFALGNAMAAIQVAEAARDYLVYPINYMLIEQKKAGEQIIGGHCPPNTPDNTCQNSVDAKNGVHPLAWGGAQEAMMTGGWGTSNGATSDFGKQFEADATVNWLVFKKLAAREILPKTAVSRCAVTQTFANLPPDTKNTIRNFLAPLFN